MTEKLNLKPGDEVLVVRPSNLNRRLSLKDRTQRAVVKSVARVWCELETHPDERFPNFWRMRLDTQDEGDRQFSQNNARFYTPEQYAAMVAKNEACALLNAQGIRVDMDSPWRGREVELADLLRKAQS